MKRSILAHCQLHSDICIIGNGLPGLVLYSALRTNPKTKHLRVSIVDRNEFPRPDVIKKEPFISELRTVSLTETSAKILQNACKTSETPLFEKHTPMHQSLLASANAHPFSRLTVRDIDRNVFSIPSSGHIVGLHSLWVNSWKSVHALVKLDESAPSQICGSIERMESDSITHGTVLHVKPKNAESEPLSITTNLLIGCDGAKSIVRESMHGQTFRIDHSQRAFVFFVEIENAGRVRGPHQQVTCYQNFLQSGSIVAFLPTSASTANIVLSASHDLSQKITKIHSEKGPVSESGRAALLEILNAVLHAHAPQDIPKVVALRPDETPLFQSNHLASFPLALNVALQPHANGKILVGDAARTIHPLAGQGLNLGIADSAVLFDCIAEVVSRGGALATEVGEKYQSRMERHSWSMIASTEISKSIFASENYWVKAMRKTGAGWIDQSTMLQRFLSSFASGKWISASLTRD